MKTKISFLFIALIFTSILSYGQATKSNPKDIQFWGTAEIQHKFGKKLKVEGSFQKRYNYNISKLNANYFDLETEYSLNKRWSSLVAYRFVQFDDKVYNRFSIGIKYDKKWDKWKTDFRLLFQNRLYEFDDSDEKEKLNALRFKSKLSYEINKKMETYLSIEPIVQSDNKKPIDNIRNIIGLEYEIQKNIKIDGFYLFRPDYGKRTYTRFFHIIGFKVQYTIP